MKEAQCLVEVEGFLLDCQDFLFIVKGKFGGAVLFIAFSKKTLSEELFERNGPTEKTYTMGDFKWHISIFQVSLHK